MGAPSATRIDPPFPYTTLFRALRTLHLLVVRLDRVVHHLLDRVDVERARRHDDEPERVRDQIDQRVIGEQPGIFGEDRGGFGVFDMRLERDRSEEHTSELQSLMRISYAVFCLKKKQNQKY